MAGQSANSRSSVANYFEVDGAGANHPIGSERHLTRADSDSAAIVVHHLPRSTSYETLQSMFLCAKDFVGADFFPDADQSGSRSAIARFQTMDAAEQVKANLNGKSTVSAGNPIVAEIWEASPNNGPLGRRMTFDMGMMRNGASSISSSASSNGINGRHLSRFNSTFGPSGGLPPFANGQTNGTHAQPGDLSSPDYHNAYQSTKNHSPNSHRVSGKAMIGEEGDDEEQAAILSDSLAYAQNDYPPPSARSSHRPSLPHFPSSAFSGLSLNSGPSTSGPLTSPPASDLPSSRSTMSMQSPNGIYSPTSSTGPNMPFHLMNQQYPRHHFPPVNPADQNPPCNTLYVGNLPVETSEEELKTIFSKQRGYRRLCFRTKQNGPMCFVEFEDISMATRALNDLYGHPLHNSVKGGIRLSFSKNPLGVRAGQHPNSHMAGSQAPPAPQGPMPSMPSMTPMQPFSTANGPPPGLAAPPGLNNQSASGGPSGMGPYSPMGSMHGMNGMMGQVHPSMMTPGYGMPMQGYMAPMRSPNNQDSVSGSTYGAQWIGGAPTTGSSSQ